MYIRIKVLDLASDVFEFVRTKRISRKTNKIDNSIRNAETHSAIPFYGKSVFK